MFRCTNGRGFQVRGEEYVYDFSVLDIEPHHASRRRTLGTNDKVVSEEAARTKGLGFDSFDSKAGY